MAGKSDCSLVRIVVLRIGKWAFASLAIFVSTTLASYVLFSDSFGHPRAQDAVIRVGWPFLMLERGGFVHREFTSVLGFAGNLAVASLLAGGMMGIIWLARRISEG